MALESGAKESRHARRRAPGADLNGSQRVSLGTQKRLVGEAAVRQRIHVDGFGPWRVKSGMSTSNRASICSPEWSRCVSILMPCRKQTRRCSLHPVPISAAEFQHRRFPKSFVNAGSSPVSPQRATSGSMRRLFCTHRRPPASRCIAGFCRSTAPSAGFQAGWSGWVFEPGDYCGGASE